MKKIVNKIVINLNHNDDVYNKFNNKILSNELRNYIYEQYTSFKEDGSIDIIISSDEDMTDKFKDNVRKMIMDDINSNIIEFNKIQKNLIIKSILLSIIGVCLIITAHFFNVYNEFVVSEVLMIAGWVSIWQVFDNLFFKQSKWQSKYNGYKKLNKCKIKFE